jgi:hypothetical protein
MSEHRTPITWFNLFNVELPTGSSRIFNSVIRVLQRITFRHQIQKLRTLQTGIRAFASDLCFKAERHTPLVAFSRLVQQKNNEKTIEMTIRQHPF